MGKAREGGAADETNGAVIDSDGTSLTTLAASHQPPCKELGDGRRKAQLALCGRAPARHRLASRRDHVPPPGIRFEHDVEVTVRDGTILHVNVFRPERDGRYPVIMCAHPYGKDRLPKRGPFGYRPPLQYRMLRQPKPVIWSAWTTWESPDPAYWVPRGYAVVNCDLRASGPLMDVGVYLLTQRPGTFTT